MSADIQTLFAQRLTAELLAQEKAAKHVATHVLDDGPTPASGTPAAVAQGGDTREAWLGRAVLLITDHFKRCGGYELNPSGIRVSVGIPSTGGVKVKGYSDGETWSADASRDGSFHVFISPRIEEPAYALTVLVHELIHTIDTEPGHGPSFKRIASAVGLVRPFTQSHAGKGLAFTIDSWLGKLGPYPHGVLLVSEAKKLGGKKKQGTRLLKAKCPRCGYTIRVTRTWADFGLPNCVCSETAFELQDDHKETEEA